MLASCDYLVQSQVGHEHGLGLDAYFAYVIGLQRQASCDCGPRSAHDRCVSDHWWE